MTSIWQLASVTAVVGMGVVFTALFLLSVYMHYFKLLTARIEAKSRAPAPAPPQKTKPVVAPVPESPPAGAMGEAGARVAAAVAVGLHLKGAIPAIRGEVAAAIATALSLHRGRAVRLGGVQPRSASAWRLAGRMEAMGGRLRRQERPLSPRG